MSVLIYQVDNPASNTATLELFCTDCDAYFGWYSDDDQGLAYAESHKARHELSCDTNGGES